MSVDNLIEKLAKTAVTVRREKAVLLKQADWPDLGQAGEYLSKTWQGLSPEQQYGLMGAGAGGLYGAVTHRPGHFLEDTAYGAGIGGAGGYLGRMAVNSLGQSRAKLPDEAKVEADQQTAAAEKIKADKLRATAVIDPKKWLGPFAPAGSELDRGIHYSDIANRTTDAAGIGAGYVAGRNLTAAGLHATNPAGVRESWQSVNKANDSALLNMGERTAGKGGEAKPYYPASGSLPTPEALAQEKQYQSALKQRNAIPTANAAATAAQEHAKFMAAQTQGTPGATVAGSTPIYTVQPHEVANAKQVATKATINAVRQAGPAGQSLPPRPGFMARAKIPYQQLAPNHRWVARLGGLGGAVLGHIATQSAKNLIPQSWTKSVQESGW